MKKIVLSALVAAAAVAAQAPQAKAQTVCPAAPTAITVSGAITTPTTWTRGNVYELSGFVYVRSGAVLTIEPGTIIKGIRSTTAPAALIIEPGAQIIANGTAAQPIVFTSNQPAGSRSRGDWGGLVLAGRAPINATGSPTVEGGIGTTYGGNLPNDNSGILRYVRIEYPGIPLSTAANSEINGLSLYGVGAGTTIEYVQVHASGDDAFEWFGGNVNARYLVATATLDDDFDTDLGFTGRVQFALSVRDAAVADQSGSTAFESDNDASGSASTPQTAPVFSNVSAFLQGTTAANYTRAMHLRRNTAVSIFNSVITGWPQGLFIEGAAAQSNATNGSLVLRNNVLAGMTANYGVNPTSGFNHQSFFEDASRGNQVFPAISALGLNADNFNSINSNGTPNGRLTSPSRLLRC
ncbi:T9SS C-terminal target domain-containing protein [Hymenobacter cellulosilyticus]|uniref:T9SS C-terminal target domain-containing protein n=1 Tax=Hymenobacter cellulosilyticus TaxID=2932248 RepID=A0A8T9Q4M2_9BACT|nr:T9SS C-terminal target domain-containing protein [Hymenobacter cellulosilyticus]UOQ72656.1 T9SS C-terminal target domain-containing protein [Hymenobacter cellulosilyticus]